VLAQKGPNLKSGEDGRGMGRAAIMGISKVLQGGSSQHSR
jgi:hypothetical protein